MLRLQGVDPHRVHNPGTNIQLARSVGNSINAHVLRVIISEILICIGFASAVGIPMRDAQQQAVPNMKGENELATAGVASYALRKQAHKQLASMTLEHQPMIDKHILGLCRSATMRVRVLLNLEIVSVRKARVCENWCNTKVGIIAPFPVFVFGQS